MPKNSSRLSLWFQQSITEASESVRRAMQGSTSDFFTRSLQDPSRAETPPDNDGNPNKVTLLLEKLMDLGILERQDVHFLDPKDAIDRMPQLSPEDLQKITDYLNDIQD